MNWRYLAFMILVMVLIGIVACQPDPKNTSEAHPPYHFVEFVKHSASCASDSMRCAAVKIEYPQYDSLALSIRQKINTSIRYQLLRAIAGQIEQDANSLDEAAQLFIDDYNEFSSVDFAMPWTLEAFSKVLRANDNWFVVAIDAYVFTGGAHPNSFRTILNYDLRQGQLISLEDIVVDKAAFSVVAERIFRREKGIEQSTSFEQAGYFMEDFKLSTQFALMPTGLLLFYNTYEIAPYVVGVTEFEIPYEEVEGFIRAYYLPN